MAIKRYFAKADNTITNAFRENLSTRGSGSNMGASDILEVFSIYGQNSSSSGLTSEVSRVLIQFETSASTNSIKADRAAGVIPASGSVRFYLRMFNAPHGQTLPTSFTMDVSAISGSWNEGTGLDMEEYRDIGRSNYNERLTNVLWSTAGGDYYTDLSSSFTASFDSGTEDIDLDITTLVEQFVNSDGNVLGHKYDNGVGVFLSNTYETAERSYYTKKFFARGTEFFFKRPHIEARWNSSIEDDRGNTFYSSSLATGEENLNTIFLYNYFRGRLRNIPAIGTGNIGVSLYEHGEGGPTTASINLVADGTHVLAATPKVVTGSHVSTGIYKASFALTAAATPLTRIHDVWFQLASNVTQASDTATQFVTGSINPKTINVSTIAPTNDFHVNITNLRNTYGKSETARFRIYTRKKDWSPTIYTKAVAEPELNLVESGSFQIFRVIDELKVIPYGTGSNKHTFLSYDQSGSYFDLDMVMLEPGYRYGINLAFYNEDIGDYVEQTETFKFKVD